jgi:hypothetical protein
MTDFEGHPDRECGEHRTTGERAWCHGCQEWCYPDSPCKGCELPQLRSQLEVYRNHELAVAVERDAYRDELIAATAEIADLRQRTRGSEDEQDRADLADIAKLLGPDVYSTPQVLTRIANLQEFARGVLRGVGNNPETVSEAELKAVRVHLGLPERP